MVNWILFFGLAFGGILTVKFGRLELMVRNNTYIKPLLGAGVLLLLLAINSNDSQLFGQQTVPPEIIVGRDKCAVCHGQEFKAWEHSSHGTKAWGLLDHPKAAGFANSMGVTDIKGNSICTQCHGTHQVVNGQLNVFPGNSCESCHGGAGGDDGWLGKHFDFGQQRNVDDSTTMADLLADRLKESSDHRALRDIACSKAGMLRAENPIAIAKNCLSCHLVPNEELLKAGHPMSSSFELVRWSNGEIRHNFLLDRSTNNEAPSNWLDEFRNGSGRTVDGRKRLMYLAGKLADLEVSLRIRGGITSTKRGTLGDKVNDRILDIQEDLGKLNIDELSAVVETTKEVTKQSLREITQHDKSVYNQIADSVSAAADNFMTAYGSGIELPKEIRVKRNGKGDAYDGK